MTDRRTVKANNPVESDLVFATSEPSVAFTSTPAIGASRAGSSLFLITAPRSVTDRYFSANVTDAIAATTRRRTAAPFFEMTIFLRIESNGVL